MKSRAIAIVAALVLCACAADRGRVRPAPRDLADRNPERRICIVENRHVAQPDFLDAYRAALEKKGYRVSVSQKNPQVSACPLTTRYVAYANGFAQLDLYWEGKPAGSAMHKSAAFSQEALQDIVDRLMP